jgi:hypothetical protein
MPKFAKHYTLAEARALLPELRALFRDAHRSRQLARQVDDKLGARLAEGGDLGGSQVAALVRAMVEINRRLARLHELGLQVKDFDRGLVDFPHLRDGREVFLCWEADEDDIEFWHDLEAGYAGRERL